MSDELDVLIHETADWLRIPSISAGAPPSWLHSDASVAGLSARGLRLAVKTAPEASGTSSRSIPAASLSSSTDTTATSGFSPTASRSAEASAATP